MKFGDAILGEEAGHVLELDDSNIFMSAEAMQNVFEKMCNFKFIPFTYKARVADIAMDIGDKFSITNTDDLEFISFIMNNSWEYNGAIGQSWSANGDNELNNKFQSKGPISQQISDIISNKIPSVYEQAVDKATELLTEFNGGYVIKKNGELFICDNEDIDKARKVWRWNINGLGYSSKGINGPYGTAITMNGQIVADFITAGTMLADRILGGILKLGGVNNTNGLLQILDSAGAVAVQMNNAGIQMADGTGLIRRRWGIHISFLLWTI